jgi:uncharacterized membrane protein YoaK (UPF0700 family)
LTLHTGFVTGTLVKMTEQFTKYLTWSFDEFRQRHIPARDVLRSSYKQQDFRLAVLLGSIWTAYVVGAICGAGAHTAVDLRCLFVPIAGLAILALVDTRKPLAVSDEKEQAKLP